MPKRPPSIIDQCNIGPDKVNRTKILLPSSLVNFASEDMLPNCVIELDNESFLSLSSLKIDCQPVCKYNDDAIAEDSLF